MRRSGYRCTKSARAERSFVCSTIRSSSPASPDNRVRARSAASMFVEKYILFGSTSTPSTLRRRSAAWVIPAAVCRHLCSPRNKELSLRKRSLLSNHCQSTWLAAVFFPSVHSMVSVVDLREFFKMFRASRDSQATLATRNCIVVCCRVATPFCDMLEPREPQTPRTCWPSNLDSSLWICALLADSSSRSLFGVSSAGQCREEHPSTGCHGDDDSSEGVDESWVASVRSNREEPAYTAMCLP